MELIAQYQPTEHRYQLGTLDVALLMQTLHWKGANIEGLLSPLAMANRDWASRESLLSYADKLRLFQAVCQAYPNEGIGLRAGQQASLSQFGVLGYAIATSPSVLDAVKTGFKYLRLNGPLFSVRLMCSDSEAVIQIENTMDIGELLPFCSEFFLSAIVSMFRQLTGQNLTLSQLKLPYTPPSYVQQYQSCFECPIEFQQSNIELRFSLHALHQSVAEYDSMALRQSLQSCQSIIETLESPQSLAQQIKSSLYQQPARLPTIEEIATEHGCSSRTLRRELKKQGVSFQSLRNDVVRDLATEMLLQTELTVDEIAFRLGYSDSANFRRAFKAWTQVPPSVLRQQVRCASSSDNA